jgi:Na+/H+ antiporter NhaA
MNAVRLGVLAGSVLSGVTGYVVLRLAARTGQAGAARPVPAE